MSDRFTVLKLTAEQSEQVRALLNGGAVFGELTLANLPGEQSEPHIFLGQLSSKTAARIRKLLA